MADTKVQQAERLGRECFDLEQEVEADRDKLRENPANRKLRLAIRAKNRQLVEMRAEGRQAYVDAGLRNAGLAGGGDAVEGNGK